MSKEQNNIPTDNKSLQKRHADKYKVTSPKNKNRRELPQLKEQLQETYSERYTQWRETGSFDTKIRNKAWILTHQPFTTLY